jgi:hypothetical protein
VLSLQSAVSSVSKIAEHDQGWSFVANSRRLTALDKLKTRGSLKRFTCLGATTSRHRRSKLCCNCLPPSKRFNTSQHVHLLVLPPSPLPALSETHRKLPELDLLQASPIRHPHEQKHKQSDGEKGRCQRRQRRISASTSTSPALFKDKLRQSRRRRSDRPSRPVLVGRLRCQSRLHLRQLSASAAWRTLGVLSLQEWRQRLHLVRTHAYRQSGLVLLSCRVWELLGG